MTTTKVPRVGTPRENHATIRPEHARTRYDGLGQRRERLERAGTRDRTNERRDAILFSFRNHPLRTVRRSPRGRGAEEASNRESSRRRSDGSASSGFVRRGAGRRANDGGRRGDASRVILSRSFTGARGRDGSAGVGAGRVNGFIRFL